MQINVLCQLRGYFFLVGDGGLWWSEGIITLCERTQVVALGAHGWCFYTGGALGLRVNMNMKDKESMSDKVSKRPMDYEPCFRLHPSSHLINQHLFLCCHLIGNCFSGCMQFLAAVPQLAT